MSCEVIMITSGKGGVGKTTATALIGRELSRMDKRVMLIDTDFGMRNLDLLFSLENKIIYNIADVLQGTCHVKQAAFRIQTGLYVLPGTKDYTFRLTQASLGALLHTLREQFDYIIFDTPAGIGHVHQTLLPFITRGIIVLTWDKPAISDAMCMSRLLHTRELPVSCILNRSGHFRLYKKQHAEAATICNECFHSRFLGEIPNLKENDLYEENFCNRALRKICSQI